MVYNRRTGEMEAEIVMGEGLVRFAYQTLLGRGLTGAVLKRRWFSRLYGFFQDRAFSAGKIQEVADALGINMAEAEKPITAFRTFNEFFARRLKPEARPVDQDPQSAVSPCDARLLVVPDVSTDTVCRIKGSPLGLAALLGDAGLAQRFAGGTLFIYRLCPADYHRFHFPETCTPDRAVTLNGSLHSVNPMALATGLPILDHNLRQRTLLAEAGPAGQIAMVEVGALCVGSIIQSYRPGERAQRGDEKGLFRFGGSTVIVLYPQDVLQVDGDILDFSAKGTESLVKMGMRVGVYIKPKKQ